MVTVLIAIIFGFILASLSGALSIIIDAVKFLFMMVVGLVMLVLVILLYPVYFIAHIFNPCQSRN